jgi:hypothetical protein
MFARPQEALSAIVIKKSENLPSQIIGNTVLSRKITFLHEQYLKPQYFLRPDKQNIK